MSNTNSTGKNPDESGQQNSNTALPELVETIRTDRSKALRAAKDIGDKAHDDAEHVDDPRSAARFVGVIDAEPMYEVVSTRLRKFPLGSDMHNLFREDQVVDWVGQNDVEIIDAESENWDDLGDEEATA